MGQEIFSILLVDDEKNERKGIEKLIQKNGYPLEIFQAENGIEALKIFDVYAKRDMLHRHNSYFLGKYKDIEILGFKSQFTMLYGNNESDYFIKADMGIGINESTKLEGIHKNNFFSTYIIGPFLVLNPHFMVELLKIMGVEDPKLAYENEIFEAYNIRLQKFKTMG